MDAADSQRESGQEIDRKTRKDGERHACMHAMHTYDARTHAHTHRHTTVDTSALARLSFPLSLPVSVCWSACVQSACTDRPTDRVAQLSTVISDLSLLPVSLSSLLHVLSLSPVSAHSLSTDSMLSCRHSLSPIFHWNCKCI